MAWYQKHLGLEETPGQGVFWNWNRNDRPYGQTIFSIFKGDTQYLQPSRSGFMINFRVADMEGLLKTLQRGRCGTGWRNGSYDLENLPGYWIGEEQDRTVGTLAGQRISRRDGHGMTTSW